MSEYVKILVVVVVYVCLFFAFGSFVTFGKKKDEDVPDGKSAGMTVVLGFFLYYIVFQIITIPMMLTGQPLHRLSVVWAVTAGAVTVSSVFLYRKEWKKYFLEKRLQNILNNKQEMLWKTAIVLIVLVNVGIVSVIYSNYWDGAYYVGSISYAVYYDSISTVNPLGGTFLPTFLEYFDLKHCLATYHMNDAVVCQLFGIHPMVEAKTIMVIVITVILNLVYIRLARIFFPENIRSRALFIGFCLLINLCTYSSYTASSFILLRTYESKAIAGAIIAVMLFYWFIRLFQEERKVDWRGLFLTSWGAAAISSSALFLVMAGMGVFAVIEWIHTRKVHSFICTIVCMVPAGIELFCILMYDIGILNIRIPV